MFLIKTLVTLCFWGALATLLSAPFFTALCAQGATPSAPPYVNSPADMRVSPLRVYVVPERADWTYQVGEPVRFSVSVKMDGHIFSEGELRYRVGPEMLPTEELITKLPANGEPLVIDGGTLNEPGFIRCDVWIIVNGRSYFGRATAGVSPDKIRPTQVNPQDFDEFWSAGLRELARVPLEPEVTYLAERSTPTVDVFHVGIRTVDSGKVARVYGILCVPKGEGPFPAVLQLPSAAVRAYSGDIALAERGVITLQIGIHGVPVNLDEKAYSALKSGGLSGYTTSRLDSREHYYYRRVYLSCVRANDFLVSLPKFDGKNLLVMGASQGGQLAIVTAALDPRVKSLLSHCPAYCDITGYLHGRAGGWPHLTRPTGDGSPSAHATEAKVYTTGYYDVVNFARRLKVPGHYSWGYNDTVCPPTSIYAAYNVISAPKKLFLPLEDGHWATGERPEIDKIWLNEQLGLAL